MTSSLKEIQVFFSPKRYIPKSRDLKSLQVYTAGSLTEVLKAMWQSVRLPK